MTVSYFAAVFSSFYTETLISQTADRRPYLRFGPTLNWYNCIRHFARRLLIFTEASGFEMEQHIWNHRERRWLALPNLV